MRGAVAAANHEVEELDVRVDERMQNILPIPSNRLPEQYNDLSPRGVCVCAFVCVVWGSMYL
jgi:hypothetical protein